MIIWTGPGQSAMGEKIYELSGFPYYGAGANAEEAETSIIVCSVESQGTGKNLQTPTKHRAGFANNVICTMPSGGKMTEQLIGRTHRPGQMADEVVVEWLSVYGDFFDLAMQSAIADAKFVMETQPGSLQKLLYATHTEL